jgi:hypothetical protein
MLKLSLHEDFNKKGKFTVDIPEGKVVRKKDNLAFEGEVGFSIDENNMIVAPEAKTTTTQSAEAIKGLRWLISWVPAAIAALSAIFIFFYPLTTKRMKEINSVLKEKKK